MSSGVRAEKVDALARGRDCRQRVRSLSCGARDEARQAEGAERAECACDSLVHGWALSASAVRVLAAPIFVSMRKSGFPLFLAFYVRPLQSRRRRETRAGAPGINEIDARAGKFCSRIRIVTPAICV
jgi:hypothetical protein